MPKIKGGNKLNEKLLGLGLNDEISNDFKDYCDNGYLGRVIAEYRGIYKVGTEMDDILARVSGKFINVTVDPSYYPAVGDWVIVDRTSKNTGEAIISKVLPRKSAVSRKVAGQRTDEQIIAANIDYLFICMSINDDFNLRRLERYITIGWNSGATPVIVLTKIDLSNNLDNIKNQIEDIAMGIDLLYVSSLDGQGMEDINKYMVKGKTIAFIGSSGVGKSTLINYLLGEEKMLVSSIREDDNKGRHTTTHRELIVIQDKGMLIDTPGMREIQLLDDIEGINDSFNEIVDLAKGCKFSDCKHFDEPGCAVKKAIDVGDIKKERLDSYNKLIKEAQYIERKNNTKSQQEYKKSQSKLGKDIRKIKTNK